MNSLSNHKYIFTTNCSIPDMIVFVIKCKIQIETPVTVLFIIISKTHTEH